MKFNASLGSGLAWAGLALVVAVPTLDFAIGQLSGPASLAINAGQAAVTAEARGGSQALVLRSTPARANEDTVVTGSIGPKAIADRPDGALPDYISGEDGQVAAIEPAPRHTPVATESAKATEPQTARASTGSRPGVVQAKPADEDTETAAVSSQPVIVTAKPAAEAEIAAETETELAAIEPAEELVAPIPLPRSARPNWTEGDFRVGDERPGGPRVIRPEEIDSDFASSDEFISAEELEEWESGPLTEFLDDRRRGRPDPERRAVRGRDDFDGDGFFLDEGPNGRPSRGDFFFGN